MRKRDYYSVLGIPREARGEEIKKAYRKLAMRYHPDKNSGSKVAEERFKEASEAYTILSDSQKRSSYDQFGHNNAAANFDGFAAGSGFGDIFEDIFSDFFKEGFSRRERNSQRGEDLKYNFGISFEEAALGAETKIKINKKESCSTCHGSGAKRGTEPVICRVCGGAGKIRSHRGFFSINQSCSNCNGKGKIIRDLCPNCYGSGMAKVEKVLSLHVPPSTETGSRLKIPGEGNHGLNGGPPGDVIVVVSVRSHSFFERDGYDIHCEIPISYTLAVSGGEKEVASLSSKVKLKIPPGTQSGQIFRLKGKGLPRPFENSFGDQMVRVNIEVPTRLTRRQKELLDEFASISGENGYSRKISLIEKIKNIVPSFSKRL